MAAMSTLAPPAIPVSSGTVGAKESVEKDKLQLPNGYRDVIALPSFKKGTNKAPKKRTQADLDDDLHALPARDAASLALDQRLHELINNLYFDVFPDEKAKTPAEGSDQPQATQELAFGETAARDQEMDDGKASKRSTEILTSLISLESMGCKICWEDTEELKKQIAEILRGMQQQPMKPLAGVGMEEVASASTPRRQYKTLPKRVKNDNREIDAQSPPRTYSQSTLMSLSTYLRKSSGYVESMRSRKPSRSKRQYLSPESSYETVPDLQSDLQDSAHHAFPNTWPIMVKNLDLDATEDDVKVGQHSIQSTYRVLIDSISGHLHSIWTCR